MLNCETRNLPTISVSDPGRALHMRPRKSARRLRIDHPDGGRIDVTAELPEHFAATMASLGFDPALGDALELDEVQPPTRAQKKAKAKAHAKQVRKGRRGERRNRGRA